MANVVARIRLANGETGYYDDKSGIFLNWSHPEADVTDDMDLSGLRVSRRCRRIKVLSGSLGKPKSFKHILAEAKAKRLGVPVEHILHKGKKRAVYETEEPAKKLDVKVEAEEKTEPAKAAPKKAEKPVVKAEAKKAEAADAKAEAPKQEAKPAAEEKKAPIKAPAKKAPTKKAAAKKTADKAADEKAAEKAAK